jgi:hypothetical protein
LDGRKRREKKKLIISVDLPFWCQDRRSSRLTAAVWGKSEWGCAAGRMALVAITQPLGSSQPVQGQRCLADHAKTSSLPGSPDDREIFWHCRADARRDLRPNRARVRVGWSCRWPADRNFENGLKHPWRRPPFACRAWTTTPGKEVTYTDRLTGGPPSSAALATVPLKPRDASTFAC